MSEFINNSEHRQKLMKEVIKELHEGKTVEEVKAKFAEAIKGVAAKDIGKMEVELVKEGLPIEEIQNLCDVHAEVFRGSIEEIHHPEEVPGHPVHTMRLENKALEEHIESRMKPNLEKFKQEDSKENILELIGDINLLFDIEKHYSRKENLIFPYLEKHGITAPPKVMWGVDDEIRAKMKDIKLNLVEYKGEKTTLIEKYDDSLHQIKEMIFKEDSILFPMSLDTLTEEEWISIYEESDEIGYAFVDSLEEWKRAELNLEEEEGVQVGGDGYVKFNSGYLKPEEIDNIFNSIPGEVTFTDKNNIVKYFSKGDERIFTRTKAVIGRNVENCHPPASVHIVDKLVEDFRSGKKDSEDFWIRMGDRFILIRFFAVRNREGDFLGTLEFAQDIAPLQEITGEKRLLED